MAADIDKIAAGVGSGANYPIDSIIGFVAAILPELPIAGGRRVDGDSRSMGDYRAIRFAARASQGMSHGRAGISLDLGSMTSHAATCAGNLTCLPKRSLAVVFGGGTTSGLPASPRNASQNDQSDK